MSYRLRKAVERLGINSNSVKVVNAIHNRNLQIVVLANGNVLGVWNKVFEIWN